MEQELAKLDAAQINSYKIEIERNLCRKHFYYYVKRAWKPCFNEELVEGWHIAAMCYHLQALVENKLYTDKGGVADTLVINLPSGCTKSSIVSILFPSWLWARKPETKQWFESFSPGLAVRDAAETRRIVKGQWFKERFWRDEVEISSDQDQKTTFRNTAGGWRLSFGIGMKEGFGNHPDVLVCLPYEQTINTDKGDLPIGDIVENEIDCKILSYDHETDKTEFQEIEEYEKNSGKEILEIESEDGDIFSVTEDHPVFVKGKGYIPAGEIQEGDKLLWLS